MTKVLPKQARCKKAPKIDVVLARASGHVPAPLNV